MSFIKFVGPDQYEQRLSEKPIALIKISSKGKVDKEIKKRSTLFDYEKIASRIKPGEVAVHLIALGCDEVYGPNRNGDAFTRQTCRDFHHTFVKHARWFREHDHNDPDKGRGIVVASAFNEPAGYIELIVALNGTKEAAQRNKGLVADKEIEALEKGKDLAVSMACTSDPNAFVLTEYGYKPISQIKIGEKVVTHNGKLHKVKDTIRRRYQGIIYRILLEGVPIELMLTPEHPLLSKKDAAQHIFDWIQVDHLRANDFLCTPYRFEGIENLVKKCDAELKSLVNFENEEDTKKLLLRYADRYPAKSFANLSDALNVKAVLNYFGIFATMRQYGKRFAIKSKAGLIFGEWRNWDLKLYDNCYFPDTKILVIDKVAYDGLVYNLEVEENESYVLNGIISHNCKVAYDVCSGCGNRSRNRDEYCDEKKCVKYGGLKKNMGKTFEDGHILRAFNPEPVFFDISYVHFPADRIAYTLGVVKRGSATWLYGPKDNSGIEKQLRALSQLAIWEEKYQYEKPKIKKAFHPKVFYSGKTGELTKYMDVPEIVYELSKMGMILSLEDFLECFGGYNKEQSTKMAKKIRPKLATVFRDILDSKDVLEKLRNNFFYPQEPIKRKDIIIMEQFGDKRANLSLSVNDVHTRCKNMERMDDYDEVKCAQTVRDKRLEKVAELYGLYQIASAINLDSYNLIAAINA